MAQTRLVEWVTHKLPHKAAVGQYALDLLTDHFGNVTALGNTTGGIVAGSTTRNDPFGNSRTTPATNPEHD